MFGRRDHYQNLGGQMADNLAIIRKLRRTHGRIPAHVSDFILQNPVETTFRMKAWKYTERLVLVSLFATIVASTSVGLSLASNGFEDNTVSQIIEMAQSPQTLVEEIYNALSVRDLSGYLAALAMLLTFSMTTAVPMRVCAVLTNIFFLVYAINQTLIPVILLHAILLPLNLRHLVRAIRVGIATASGRIDPDL